jgi:hypothetical protein
MSDQPKKLDLTNALDESDATAWRVLRQTTLRALVHASGRTPTEVTAAEADTLLEPFTAHLQRDCVMLREAFRRMYLLGVEGVTRELHGQPGVDDEALDQAVEFHSNPDDTNEAFRP